MKYLKYKQAELVTSIDDYNAAMKRLAEMKPIDDVQIHDGNFVAVIRYEVEERVPETVRDEFALEGISYKCYQCPLHDEIHDRRKATVSCKYGRCGQTRLKEECCETFYRRLARGEIKIGGEENEEEI